MYNYFQKPAIFCIAAAPEGWICSSGQVFSAFWTSLPVKMCQDSQHSTRLFTGINLTQNIISTQMTNEF